MATGPIDRSSVREFRDCLLEFGEFLDSIGDDIRPSKFAIMAAALESARKMSDVRVVQRQAREFLMGTVGTLSDGPPVRENSARFRYDPHSDLYGEFDEHMDNFRSFAHKIVWF